MSSSSASVLATSVSDAGLALEEQGPLQPEREEQRHRKTAIGDVAVARERALKVVYRIRGPHDWPAVTP